MLQTDETSGHYSLTLWPRRGVPKGVEDGRRPLIARRRVGHGGPGWYFKESMATPRHTPMAIPCHAPMATPRHTPMATPRHAPMATPRHAPMSVSHFRCFVLRSTTPSWTPPWLSPSGFSLQLESEPESGKASTVFTLIKAYAINNCCTNLRVL
jgi:hypothetical protein